MIQSNNPSPANPASVAATESFRETRRCLVDEVSRRMEPAAGVPAPSRAEVETHVAGAIAASNRPIADAERAELTAAVVNELIGFGPIQPLLDDPSVTEVMVNRADRVYVERAGRPVRTAITFDDDAHVHKIIDRIVRPLGRRLDAEHPLVDARLPDGSRVNAVIPPVAIAGPCLTIRKFSKTRMTLEDLAKRGAMPLAIAEFLRLCVLGRLNIIVTGGTGSGKTTLLNALSGCIPDHERIVTIEDAAELRLAQDHVITLEAKQPNRDGSGEVSIRELVRNALRMRPERIVVGECRGGETLDMLQAMNTGHDGSLTTLHANTPRDAISRIETMSLMAGIDLPVRAIREQMGSAIELVVQVARMRDGSRKITYITEIAGMEGDKVVLQEVFRFREIPSAPGTPVAGWLQATGLRPRFMAKLDMMGLKLPPSAFVPSNVPPPGMAA